jgi:hypothetical protein
MFRSTLKADAACNIPEPTPETAPRRADGLQKQTAFQTNNVLNKAVVAKHSLEQAKIAAAILRQPKTTEIEP